MFLPSFGRTTLHSSREGKEATKVCWGQVQMLSGVLAVDLAGSV